MAIDLLDTPLRVTWDLCSPVQPVSAADTLEIAARLVEAQLFYVTLERTPLLHPLFRDVATTLAAAGCQLLVTCCGSVAELSELKELPDHSQLLLDVGGFVTTDGVDFTALEQTCSTLCKRGVNYGLTLTPTPERLGMIGALLRFCLHRQIPRFKLPNMRINDNFSPTLRSDLLHAGDIERFRQLAVDFPDFSGELQLDVHDLFLWEILFPNGGAPRSEYGGCQAANSLAHIDCTGIVHPCLSWPQPLGSLLRDSFYAIWQDVPRQKIRDSIAVTPDGCQRCRDYSLCFGGCRGLSRLEELWQGRDLMCAGECKLSD
ncbi:MAG: SPASM domain-containing protein [Desulfuromonadales bacterium]|nr:SPASM domain-containing protein [Desulfuromonadales bacterium]